MNKIKIKLYILVIFLIPKSLLAIEYSHLKIGGSFYNYQYEEPNIMNLKGTMKE